MKSVACTSGMYERLIALFSRLTPELNRTQRTVYESTQLFIMS